jgi:hypothetical protein
VDDPKSAVPSWSSLSLSEVSATLLGIASTARVALSVNLCVNLADDQTASWAFNF